MRELPRKLPILLTVKEYCQVFRTSHATVWRAIAEGKLRTTTVGGVTGPGIKRLIVLDEPGGTPAA